MKCTTKGAGSISGSCFTMRWPWVSAVKMSSCFVTAAVRENQHSKSPLGSQNTDDRSCISRTSSGASLTEMGIVVAAIFYRSGEGGIRVGGGAPDECAFRR